LNKSQSFYARVKERGGLEVCEEETKTEWREDENCKEE
jgi:hypothetical protein